VFEFLGHHEGSADPNSFKPEVWQSERMPTISQIEFEGKHPEAKNRQVPTDRVPT
jgi:hypothetical protein